MLLSGISAAINGPGSSVGRGCLSIDGVESFYIGGNMYKPKYNVGECDICKNPINVYERVECSDGKTRCIDCYEEYATNKQNQNEDWICG